MVTCLEHRYHYASYYTIVYAMCSAHGNCKGIMSHNNNTQLLPHIECTLDFFNNMPLQSVGLGMFIVSKSHFLPKEMLQ